MGDKVRGYAFTMLLIQLAFLLLGLTGLYPYRFEIAGFDVYEDINKTTTEIQEMYSSVAGGGTLAYAAITTMTLLMGVKILLEFLILVVIGAYPILTTLGLPAAFALPISAIISAIMLYELVYKFLGR
ncbi:MAG: hypothetical protein QM426_10525 [Euryarchaeota archaeon]|nr:hypothetical protein [Euryarchaeota archaeon]